MPTYLLLEGGTYGVSNECVEQAKHCMSMMGASTNSKVAVLDHVEVYAWGQGLEQVSPGDIQREYQLAQCITYPVKLLNRVTCMPIFKNWSVGVLTCCSPAKEHGVTRLHVSVDVGELIVKHLPIALV
jgi:hypothetical protein